MVKGEVEERRQSQDYLLDAGEADELDVEHKRETSQEDSVVFA